MLVGSVLAAGDTKEGDNKAKAKRDYSLGYGYAPYTSFYDHAPIASAFAEVHHAPVVAHAPVVSAVAPLAKVTSSIVSTNVHHYPAAYYSPAAPIISSAPLYHAPTYAASSYVAPAYTASYVAPAYAHSPFVTEFHRR